MKSVLVRVDNDTYGRLKSVAGDKPVAAWLRQHTKELVVDRIWEEGTKDLWQELYNYTFTMRIKNDKDYQKFRAGIEALLVTAATMAQGKKTADHGVYKMAISRLKEQLMDEQLRQDLLQDLFEMEATLDIPQEEAERRVQSMYEGLLERSVKGDEEALDTLLYMMKIIPAGSSEEKILLLVLKQNRWQKWLKENVTGKVKGSNDGAIS